MIIRKYGKVKHKLKMHFGDLIFDFLICFDNDLDLVLAILLVKMKKQKRSQDLFSFADREII